MSVPAILDCDTGHDDAMAILLAGRLLDLKGVTAVHGNAPVENTTVNACKILELAGLERIPVAMGAARPRRRRLSHAPGVHGATGMDGPDLPEPSIRPVAETAPAFIARMAAETEGLHLVATGPLTNIAAALEASGGRLASRIAGIALMGGSIGQGNASAVAEFNVWADPEAADLVFRSGAPIRMVGLNVTRQVTAAPERVAAIRALGTATARAAADLLEFFGGKLRRRYGLAGASMHDPLAVAALADPEVLRFEAMRVEIELSGAHAYGMTVCDFRHLAPEAHGHGAAARAALRAQRRSGRGRGCGTLLAPVRRGSGHLPVNAPARPAGNARRAYSMCSRNHSTIRCRESAAAFALPPTV